MESESLRRFVEKVFQAIGCPEEDARLAADVLVSADLNGVDSHGVARLPGYVRLYDHGRLNPRPDIRIIHEKYATATVDGDRGLGLVVGPYAMKVAIDKARTHGTGFVAVRNSNHFGIAGYHASLALENDMIGWAMTNSAPLVVPTFSKEKLLGTNPIAVAVPAGQQPPFLTDFATSAVAYGKMEIYQRLGLEVPFGWAQDEHGLPTHNANAVKEGGGLLPLGGSRENGGHKGYGLSSVVVILTGVLSGANFGPWVPPFATAGFHGMAAEQVGEGTGHFFGAMAIDGFQPAENFKMRMDQWIERFRSAKSVEGHPIQIPGDQERISREERLKTGIPLNDKVKSALLELSERFKIKL